jgi:DedD protein
MRSFVEEEEKESPHAGTDTEITLGMKSLLGVFFGSVLVCGVFFGFGYSLGRGNAHPGAATTASSPAIAVKRSASYDTTRPATTESASVEYPQTQSETIQPETTGDSNPKTVITDEAPAKASPSASATAGTQYEYVPTPGGPARRPAGAPLKPAAKPSAAIAGATPLASPAYTQPSTTVESSEASAPPAPPQPEPVLMAARIPSPTAAALAMPATTPGASATMVQIAAITHQEDANILVAALRKRGYSVLVRNEPRDSLLHVQIGPFASRDEAKAMRTRLLADGYNAILK